MLLVNAPINDFAIFQQGSHAGVIVDNELIMKGIPLMRKQSEDPGLDASMEGLGN